MKTVAIIPARGGSKRIPRKNVRPFCGKPIIAYSIEAARRTGLFDAVIVSTDDEEIAAIAKQYGATTPFMRPDEIADDMTGVRAVITHALRELEKEGERPAEVCMIYATAPLMQSADIVAGYEQFQACIRLESVGKGADFVFSAAEFASPIFRAFGVRDDGTAKMFWPEHYRKNSQDLPAAYHDAAQFCWGRREAMLEENIIVFSGRSVPFIVPRYRVVDIDTPEDWRLAELLYRALNKTDQREDRHPS